MPRRLLCLLFLLPLLRGADGWEPLQFLIGHWTGEGSGTPGNGTGAFSFEPDLQRHILVRKSFAKYPPANGKSAYRHDDLLIVYREGDQLHAIYFDSEDHVIHYAVDARTNQAVFTSDGARSETRYRMTYRATTADRLSFRFEIGAPGKDFAPYIDAVLRRDPPAKGQ